jgi:hypothetical protein
MSYCFDGATPWNRSRLKSVKRHGGVAVSVYIVGTPGGMRCAAKQDVDLARSLGLGVLPNWERAADFFRHATLIDCRAAGREALAACRALGFPDDGSVSVAFSFDFQIPASQYGEMADKLAAINDVLGGHYRGVAYGQFGLIDYLARHGRPGPHWLMGSTFRASSQFYVSEVRSPHVAMVQMHDAGGNWLSSPVSGTDINTVTQPQKLGAWWPTNSPYAQGAGMTMDKDVAAAFANVTAGIAAVNKRLDAMPAQVWKTKLRHPQFPDDPDRAYSAAGWVTSTRIQAGAAVVEAKKAACAVQATVVDTAAVIAQITDGVKAKLAALFTGGV